MKIKIYFFFKILLFFFLSLNLFANIIYDKENLIITSIELENFIQIYNNSVVVEYIIKLVSNSRASATTHIIQASSAFFFKNN